MALPTCECNSSHCHDGYPAILGNAIKEPKNVPPCRQDTIFAVIKLYSGVPVCVWKFENLNGRQVEQGTLYMTAKKLAIKGVMYSRLSDTVSCGAIGQAVQLVS